MHRLYEEVWLEAEHSEIAGCATEAGRIAEEEARTQRSGGGGGRWGAPERLGSCLRVVGGFDLTATGENCY